MLLKEDSSLKKKTIYIIRHGQTNLNLQGIVQGRGMDTDLNEFGIKQGEAFYEAYKNIPFDKIYISTLKRTFQTVKKFIDQGIPYEKLKGLDELGWGIWEGQPSTSRSRAAFSDLANEWEAGNYDAKTENGESPNEVLNRQKIALQYILDAENENTVLICMHGRAMRLLLCYLLKKPLCEMKDFPHSNTSLYILDYKGGDFKFKAFNNLKHLDHLNE